MINCLDSFLLARSTDEQQISEESSTVVNAAFKTLKSDSKRAWYLLSLKEDSNRLPFESSSPSNAAFLKEIMEWNERVDQLKKQPQQMQNCLDSISSAIRKLYVQIHYSFENNRFNDVRVYLIQLNYWENLLHRIKQ